MPESSRPRPIVTGGAAQALSSTCHYLHLGIMLFIMLGWIVPFDAALLAHLILVPVILGIWYLNDCSCPLNNIESYLLKGLWRDPDNREEGSFVVVVVDSSGAAMRTLSFFSVSLVISLRVSMTPSPLTAEDS